MIDFDVEFFEGENEHLLLKITLNDVELEDLPKFQQALQGYLDASAVINGTITKIDQDGCDDAIIYFTHNGQPMTCDICSETTFEQMLQTIEDSI